MLEKEQFKAFIDAYETCLNSEATTFFEQFQFDYVCGSSPLPSFLDEEIVNFLKDEAYIILSKKSTNYLDRKLEHTNEDEVIINVNAKLNNVSISEENKNDFSTDCFDESILPPNIQTFHGGSPLKLHDYQKDIKLNESVVEGTEHYLPLERAEAITFISYYNIGLAQRIDTNNFKPLRLWICTKLSSFHRFVFISSILTFNLEEETKSTFINTVDVTHKKYYCNNNEDELLNSMFSFTLTNTKNLNYSYKSSYILHKSKANQKEVNLKTKDILDAKNTPQNWNNNQNYNEIKLSLDWSEESDILACPPLQANAMLIVNIWDGTVNPQLIMLYDDLCTLKKFLKGLNDGKFEWSEDKGNKSKKELMQELIKKHSMIGVNPQILDDQQLQKDFGASESGKSFDGKHCRDLDLIDKVWIILKDSCSYEDLVEGFRVLFDAMKDSLFKPTINPNNKSILAQMFQENLSSRREIKSWLRDDRPVVMLMEIGLEKLKLDYFAYFLKLNLINSGQLYSHFGEVFENLETKHLKLCRIHRLLEINLFLSTNTSLNHSVITSFIKHTMQLTDITNSVKLSVPFTNVYNLIENLNPFDWQCVVSGEIGNEESDKIDDIVLTNAVDDLENDGIDSNDTNTKKERVFNFFHFSTTPVFHETDADENEQGKSRYYITCLHQDIYQRSSFNPKEFKFRKKF